MSCFVVRLTSGGTRQSGTCSGAMYNNVPTPRVIWRVAAQPRAGARVFSRLSQFPARTDVDHPGVSRSLDHDVRRLQIAVEDLRVVDVLDGASHVFHEPYDGAEVLGRPTGRAG